MLDELRSRAPSVEDLAHHFQIRSRAEHFLRAADVKNGGGGGLERIEAPIPRIDKIPIERVDRRTRHRDRHCFSLTMDRKHGASH
jgi:hypothetical protein